MVIDCRDLADTTGHGHRQFAGRIDLAGKDFGDSLATHLPRLPDIEDRIHILFGPSKAVGPARHKYEHGRFARRGHCLK